MASDLISRKELLELYEGLDGQGLKVPVEVVVQNIKDMPTVDRWIPCSERMPKKSGTYLISGIWGKETVGDCDFSVNDGYFRTAWNFDVLAWMPLPEPYKGE